MSTSSPRRRLTTVAEVCKEYLDRVQHMTRAMKDRRTNILAFSAAKGHIAIDDLIADDLEKWIEDHPSWKSAWTRRAHRNHPQAAVLLLLEERLDRSASVCRRELPARSAGQADERRAFPVTPTALGPRVPPRAAIPALDRLPALRSRGARMELHRR